MGRFCRRRGRFDLTPMVAVSERSLDLDQRDPRPLMRPKRAYGVDPAIPVRKRSTNRSRLGRVIEI